MIVRVHCPSCGRKFKIDARHAGKKGRCPHDDCAGVFDIPSPSSSTEDEVLSELPGAGGPRRSRSAPVSAKAKPAPIRGRGKKSKTSPAWYVAIGGAALIAAIVVAVLPWMGTGAGSANSDQAGQLQAAAPKRDDFAAIAAPFLKQYCFECHSGDSPEASISFERYHDERSILKDRRLWERGLDLMKQGLMPPPDATQPAQADKDKMVAFLDHALFFVDCTADVDPGRVTIRRLNRAEYNNTIRDLVGVDFKPAEDFPTDDVGYGFDNIGDVLSLPPLLLEKYLDASEAISSKALVVADPKRPTSTVIPDGRLVKSPVVHPSGPGYVLVSTGFLATDFDFPATGEYILKARAGGDRAGDELPNMRFLVDDKTQKDFAVAARGSQREDYQHKVTVARGRHRFSVAFTNDFYDEKKKQDRNLHVDQLEIIGPLTVDPAAASPFQKQFLAQRPSTTVAASFAVRENLRPFLKRAYRRPIQDPEMDGYVRLVEQALNRGDTFEQAMQLALTGILVSPQFLFRVETDRQPNDPSDRHVLNDFELANRLSYFLWSSMPDEELFALAERNELHKSENLDTQIRRMLKDPRSQALVDNFAEQWLQLRILNEITPDPKLFPGFTNELRSDMLTETKQLFAHVMREDRSLLDLLTADYTFVNERLAKHYGMPGITGQDFQKVNLGEGQRTGLLTHASILTMNSNPNRTSPVKRGKWIMEVVLNTPPPPPPPNVPELEAAKAPEGSTLRQQLELHRQNATCNSCHRVMDELGFGLENFDAIGRWRDRDGSTALDTRGQLPDGALFQTPKELAAVLRKKDSEFGHALSEKMLTYALGRGLEYYDRCTVNRISEALKAGEFKFSALVSAVVRSEAFSMRRGEGADDAVGATSP